MYNAIEMGELFVEDFKKGFWGGFGHEHVREVCSKLIDELDKVVDDCGDASAEVKNNINILRRNIFEIQVYNEARPKNVEAV